MIHLNDRGLRTGGLTLRRRTALAGALLLTLTSGAALGQELTGDGFRRAAATPIPVPFSAYATLSSGNRVFFDGMSIDLYDGQGTWLQNLDTFPSYVYASFVVIDPTETFAIVGESSNMDLFRVPLDGSGKGWLANLVFNYDAAFEDASHVIVSQSIGWGNPNNLVRLNVDTGATQLVASVDGPSGPVAVDASGALFYGTVSPIFPAPPGSSSIITWTSAQTHGTTLLTESEATVFCAGLDAAASMAIDPVYGNVFLAESVYGSTSRILELERSSGAVVDVIVQGRSFLTRLELMHGSDAGHFHAYQPSDGVFLHYDDGTDVVTVRPRRPSAELIPQPYTNSVTLRVKNGKPFGTMLVSWCPQSVCGSVETPHDLGFGFLYDTPMPLPQIRRLAFEIPLDSRGNGGFTYFDSGSLAGTLAFQAIINDCLGNPVGTSRTILN